MTAEPEPFERLSTGISGLDEILHGGLIAGRAYLVRGGPGSGKTTVGLHFLTAGETTDERGLFITLGESAAQIRQNAAVLGITFKKVAFMDFSPSSAFFTEVESYDIFAPAEVERTPITQQIIERVEALTPQRVFVDAMTQFRYLATDAFQFRRQALALLRFLTERGATVLFTSEGNPESPDDDLQFMADGVIHLEAAAEGRVISVTKLRGSDFRSGGHAMKLTANGLEVFPRLLPETYGQEFMVESLSSGIPALDELLHGGLERGTISIISGPTGIGKTTLGLQFMKEAAGRGERSVVYTFEEGLEMLTHRCEAVNIPVKRMMMRGTLAVVAVEPLQFTPDEFAQLVRHEVEEQGTRIVMIDSTAGYRLSLRGADLVSHLHALGKYLQNMGVMVLLISEIEFITGEFRATEVGISYMADNIIFLRYLEMRGALHRAIGVLKKRLTSFEKTLREIEVSRYGIKVGRPLTELRGILRGTPEWGDAPSTGGKP